MIQILILLLKKKYVKLSAILKRRPPREKFKMISKFSNIEFLKQIIQKLFQKQIEKTRKHG